MRTTLSAVVMDTTTVAPQDAAYLQTVPYDQQCEGGFFMPILLGMTCLALFFIAFAIVP